jgi:hypothetical protein
MMLVIIEVLADGAEKSDKMRDERRAGHVEPMNSMPHPETDDKRSTRERVTQTN